MLHTLLRYAAILCCFLSTSALFAAQLPEGFVEVQVATNLNPTTMALAPDGRVFIAEKNGVVRIVRDDMLLPDPFILLDVDDYNERGLSGIAFHPNFEQNNWVYLFYTAAAGNFNRISRVTANGDFAIPGSEETLLELDPLSGTIHNGGAMQFGPDGKLYIATGDGALPDNAQALDNLLGKILRINDDGTIPTDNPYFNQAQGIYRSIYAVGFRNPFTMAIQPETGRLFVNDVGSEYFEEVNRIVAGGNYGWAFIEGMRTFQAEPANYQDPLVAYGHDIGCAIMGAAFYNPLTPTFPEEYHGKYFYGDYCEGFIKVIDPLSGEEEGVFASGINRPISIMAAPNGDLYYIERAGLGGGSQTDNTSTNDGTLWRIRYTGTGAPVVAVQPQSIMVPVGEDASFFVQASGEAPISYQWQRDGVDLPDATSNSLTIPTVQLLDDGSRFRCRISNNEGTVMSLEAILSVTSNTRPTPAIVQPTEGLLYQAGDTIFFSGSATDAEDGPLAAGQLTWRVDFHHDAHTHPTISAVSGITNGYFVVPQIGEIDDNVWFRIYLTAVDGEGLERRVYREVFPIKTSFVVQTEPPGLEVNIDGRLVPTPFNITSVQGIRRTLSAPLNQVNDTQIYTFDRWTDDWSQQFFSFFAGEVDTVTAHYNATELVVGEGTGLTARYYHGSAAAAFNTPPVLERVDAVVDFNWGGESPDPLLEADFFTVRWTGEVMPMVSGPINFHTITDDGVRLWVNDELLIDQWIPQAATEWVGTIDLEAGIKYPIRLEYYEEGGEAVANLAWSNSIQNRETIPSTQLFPEPSFDFPGRYQVKLFPSPAADLLTLEIQVKTNSEDLVNYHIYDVQGRMLGRGKLSVTSSITTTELDVSNYAPGVYIVDLEGEKFISEVIKFIKR